MTSVEHFCLLGYWNFPLFRRQFPTSLLESFPFRVVSEASLMGNTRCERRGFRVPLTRDFSRLPQNGIEIVSGQICLLFIDFYNLFRMFPDFSLLLQNIPRITDLHVTCSCRSSPLSQSLVLLGKWIFSILIITKLCQYFCTVWSHLPIRIHPSNCGNITTKSWFEMMWQRTMSII